MSSPAVRQVAGIVRAGRVPRPVAREIVAAQAKGAVAAATIHAAGQVTHVALSLVASMSAEEERLVGICPIGEPRYKVLADQFTAVAANEIAKLTW